ncbi:choline ABC transporter ATP-binding protein [Aureimonas fodinaquatilis]|uniref:Trimethylamine N-oxide transport system ATP-binding protein TmoW n=1 Tax=Aureimonas fodinaquatilis TaxID=2565783 RepID=A0A5B0DZ00_9HYPH|nr:choline ABC transporter ATP-binding protein [Aureimonas fodinaquatilis]KAA0972034.1 choline ABC transporter ATP-binding protein [Aureimonas fodinaquatilis]
MTPIVSFQNVSILFGNSNGAGLDMLDRNCTRDEIRQATGATLGVANASLDVNAGEIVVLMGLSGSGKSTLIRAVNALAPISRGRVLVNTGRGEIDVHAASSKRLRELRRHEVAMVFQQFALLPWRSVVENVALGLQFSGIDRAERRRKAMEKLEIVGLQDWADSRVNQLSGGMQQRVGLARAFATDAPILLMDEPFSALDPLIRTKLQDELLESQRKFQKTIIFVSHDLDEAFKLGNRIAIMQGGRIVQVGSASEIVRQPAGDYVAEFVAHVNPMNVLTAQDVMAPLADAGTNTTLASMAHPETPLRRIMEILRAHSGEVIIAEKGRVVGRVGPREVVAALTRPAPEKA